MDWLLKIRASIWLNIKIRFILLVLFTLLFILVLVGILWDFTVLLWPGFYYIWVEGVIINNLPAEELLFSVEDVDRILLAHKADLIKIYTEVSSVILASLQPGALNYDIKVLSTFASINLRLMIFISPLRFLLFYLQTLGTPFLFPISWFDSYILTLPGHSVRFMRCQISRALFKLFYRVIIGYESCNYSTYAIFVYSLYTYFSFYVTDLFTADQLITTLTIA